jgi:hypothetical protein
MTTYRILEKIKKLEAMTRERGACEAEADFAKQVADELRELLEEIDSRGDNKPNLLDGYLTRKQLAQALAVCERSIARAENQPDGLPSLMIGGRKLYRIDAVRQWLARRERIPNPTRHGGAYVKARNNGTRNEGARARHAGP